MGDYGIGSELTQVVSDLGTLAMKPVKAIARGVLGLVTILTLEEGMPKVQTTAEKIGLKAKEWKGRIEASDRPTHLGIHIQRFFGSVRDTIKEKFTPARQVLIKQGPLNQAEAEIADATREIDPFIAGFDSDNREKVRMLYYEAKTTDDSDRHGWMMDSIAALKIHGWKREHLRELGKVLSVQLFSLEQSDPHIEVLRQNRKIQGTPRKVLYMINDIEDPQVRQTIQLFYHDAQKASKKEGVSEAQQKLKTAVQAIEGLSTSEKRDLAENLSARLQAESVPKVKRRDRLQDLSLPEETPPAQRTISFAEPQSDDETFKGLPKEILQALETALPFLSSLQKDRIARLFIQASKAARKGKMTATKRLLSSMEQHCNKVGFLSKTEKRRIPKGESTFRQEPALATLFDAIQKNVLQNASLQRIASKDRYSITSELIRLVDARQLDEMDALTIRQDFIRANKSLRKGKLSEEQALQKINDKMQALLGPSHPAFNLLKERMAVLLEGADLMPKQAGIPLKRLPSMEIAEGIIVELSEEVKKPPETNPQ